MKQLYSVNRNIRHWAHLTLWVPALWLFVGFTNPGIFWHILPCNPNLRSSYERPIVYAGPGRKLRKPKPHLGLGFQMLNKWTADICSVYKTHIKTCSWKCRTQGHFRCGVMHEAALLLTWLLRL